MCAVAKRVRILAQAEDAQTFVDFILKATAQLIEADIAGIGDAMKEIDGAETAFVITPLRS